MLSLLLAAEIAKLGAADRCRFGRYWRRYWYWSYWWPGYGRYGSSAREDGRPPFFYDYRSCVG